MKKSWLIFIAGLLLLDAVLAAVIGGLYGRSPLTDPLRSDRPAAYFGDSKFHFGVDPDAVARQTGVAGYNFGHESGGIVYSKGIQSVLFARSKPRLVVLEAMDFSTEKAAEGRLAPFLSNPEVGKLFARLPLSVRLRYGILKTARYNWVFPGLVKSWFFPPHASSSGFSDWLHGTRPILPLIKPPVLPAGRIRFYGLLLDEFMNEARKAGAAAVVVEMPLRHGVRSPYYETYRSLAQRHGAVFLDFSRGGKDFLFIPDKFFYDENHLNAEGAAFFSEALGRKLASALQGGNS